jgi:hypothetical protein
MVKLAAVLLCAVLAADDGGNNRPKKSAGYLPEVYIIGAQKSGSSSLHEMLLQHPLLLKGFHKEVRRLRPTPWTNALPLLPSFPLVVTAVVSLVASPPLDAFFQQ